MNFRLVDLTHTISEDMPVYPGDNAPRIIRFYNHNKDGFQELELALSTHTGTHIDCPLHFFEGEASTESMSVNSFFGTAVVINCFGLKGEIPLSEIEKHRNRLEDTDFLLFNTGYDKWWGLEKYFNEFPSLSENAANYLLSFKLKGIGFDTISADHIASENFPIHNLLLKNNVVIIENLTGLSNLPGHDFYFSCFPLKIVGGDGSPVRAVAYVPE